MKFWFGVSCIILLGVITLFTADISGLYVLTEGEGPALLITPAAMFALLVLGGFIARKSARRIWIGQGMVIVFALTLTVISWTYRSVLTPEAATSAAHDAVALLTSKAQADRLIPKPPAAAGHGLISVQRGAGGHFWVEAAVNGTHVRFLVDTGASFIALTRTDALRLGFDGKELDFSLTAQTPNGPVGLAPVMIDEIRIGGIRVKNLQAAVVDSVTGHSLLGMNFLQQLQQFEIRGDILIMRQ